VGTENEILAQAILCHFAFTTAVARENDVGSDLVCVLAERRDNIIEAGPACVVQIKSKQQQDQVREPPRCAMVS
jgi:hypothetical protein